MNKDDYRYINNITFTIPKKSIDVTIRNIRIDDIDKILQLQEVSFAGLSNIIHLFVLELSSGQVFSLNADGSDRKVIISGCRHPDDIVVDVEAGHIY
jgi:hypothetical protein